MDTTVTAVRVRAVRRKVAVASTSTVSVLCSTPSEPSCFDAEGWIAFCESNEPSWNSDAVDAFSSCATDDPLCFQTIEQCTMMAMFPEPIVADVQLAGTDLANWQGLWIDVGFDGPNGFVDVQTATISEGAFALQWTREMQHGWDSSVGFHLDANGDQQCDASDPTGLLPLKRAGPLQDSRFELVITEAELDKGGFLCAFF